MAYDFPSPVIMDHASGLGSWYNFTNNRTYHPCELISIIFIILGDELRVDSRRKPNISPIDQIVVNLVHKSKFRRSVARVNRDT